MFQAQREKVLEIRCDRKTKQQRKAERQLRGKKEAIQQL
jgi:hypothetical protein